MVPQQVLGLRILSTPQITGVNFRLPEALIYSWSVLITIVTKYQVT